jgi:hypothetical protein
MAKDEKPKRKPVGDYAVGYAKPPEHTRFKPGTSGNPKGTRKPRLTIDELVDAELNSLTSVKLGGEVIKLSKRVALVKRIVSDALQGDRHAQTLALRLSAQAQARREDGSEAPLTEDEIEQLKALVRFQEEGPKDDEPAR